MKIVILATRISGTDGVSLEAERWREILTKMGHNVVFVAGQLDRSGTLIPELHFAWPKVVELHDRVVHSNGSYEQVEAEIFDLAGKIEGKLRKVFHNSKKPDLLIVPNVFSIPMHFPLAVALARVIGEDSIPTIARHHDFWWERKRFMKSTMFPFFERWFPPLSPTIKHVVVNSLAKKEFKKRTGIDAEIFWDTFDFNSNLNKIDSYSKSWRSDFGIREDDIVFLQPTRIIPRKRIELSIELVKKLNNPKIVLVLAGYAGDEGREYEMDMQKLAMKAKIRFLAIGNYINSKRRLFRTSNYHGTKTHRIYTLWDCFVNADLITYPTIVEGFGNQFVETMYFKKPIIITPYSVFKSDIEPIGFDVVSMPHKVTKTVVKQIKRLIEHPDRKEKMVEKNFKLARKHYSYQKVEKKLKGLFKKMELSSN